MKLFPKSNMPKVLLNNKLLAIYLTPLSFKLHESNQKNLISIPGVQYFLLFHQQ